MIENLIASRFVILWAVIMNAISINKILPRPMNHLGKPRSTYDTNY